MTRRRALPAVLSALLIALATVVAAQPRDNAPRTAAAPAGTVITGRVTAAVGGQPLYRVRVLLTGSAAAPPPATTDPDGNFELDDVPAGIYTITASRNGYLPAQYGQPRPGEAGRAIEVKADATVAHVDFALVASGVVAGRVVDDAGEPYPALRVEAMTMQYTRGRRVPLQAGNGTTNDLGEFRITGLAPGAYYVLTVPTETWQDVDETKGAHAYAQTYYPGVADFDQAQAVTIAAGQAFDVGDIRLATGRAAVVSGVVLDASGAPMANQSVNMDRITRTIGGALYSAGFGGAARSDAAGRFQFRDVAPGEYNVYVGSSQTETAAVSVRIAGADVTGLTLAPRKPSALTGTIVSDDGTPMPFSPVRVRVVPVFADPAVVLAPWGAAQAQPVTPTWTFRAGNISGSYLLRVTGMPDDWVMKSVTMGSRDVTDTPIEIMPGDADASVRVTVTHHSARASGDVVTARGGSAGSAYVIVFPQEERLWTIAPRQIKAVRTDAAGHFTTVGLLPGDYYAASSSEIAEGQWEDPAFLRALARDASRVKLSDAAETIVPPLVLLEGPR